MPELDPHDLARLLCSFPEGLSRFRAVASDLGFASRSEAATAFFLSRYSDWQPIPGATIHIKVATKEIDFYLPAQRTFIEYHPITRWDWKSSQASALYGEHFRRLSGTEKRESWAAIKAEFAQRYYRERRLVLDLTGHKSESLIHAQNAADFHKQVICGLLGQKIPEAAFLKEWSSFINGL